MLRRGPSRTERWRPGPFFVLQPRAMTLQEELEKIDGAIARILETEGQEWVQGGRSRKNARLESLYARKAEIEQKLALQDRGGRRVTRFVPR